MLGLRYGTVALVPYTEQWALAFEDERRRLRDALGSMECRIEHVGSTAVAGLSAKPILDLALGIAAPHSVDAFSPILERLGYEYRGDAGAAGGHVFVREAAEKVRTHHVHLVHVSDPQFESYLALRDFLRVSESARTEYAATKESLAQRFPDDRKSYTAAKREVIDRLLGRARADSRRLGSSEGRI